MRILIVDQCSNDKNTPDRVEPLGAETIDSTPLAELQTDEECPTVPARQLYAGRQQRYVSEAVDRFRNAGDVVDRVFISAGFGVVAEDDPLPPYDVTFADHTATEIDTRADKLGITDDVIALADDYDLIVFALGADYYRSMGVEQVLEAIPTDTLTVLFNREEEAREFEHVISLPARTAEAKEFGTIVVALKGTYLKNLAGHRAEGAAIESLTDIETLCTTEYRPETSLDNFD